MYTIACLRKVGEGSGGSVKGRLKSHYEFWESVLDASQFATSMIREGYRLPFSEYPTPCFLKNNRSAFKHLEFVVKAIEELLCNNCVIEHEFPPYCVNPLTVAEGKKLRLVIDLRHVNAFVSKVEFKYEDLRSLSQVLEENHWFFTWDLKSGYHQEVVPLPRIKDLLLEGPGQAILYKRRQSVFVGCPAFRTLALRLEFI